MSSSVEIVNMENLDWLRKQPDEMCELVVIDVPFNTGHRQERQRNDGTVDCGYEDSFDDFVEGFMSPRMNEARRILKPTGSLFFWADWHEIHYCKVMLDKVFGRSSFKNEIIWAYDYGARSKSRWAAKHDNILWYAKNPENYTFNYDVIDRVPYMAEERQTEERAREGKVPTDVWWHTIVPTQGHEKTGYATQKPVQLLERIVRVHSNPGDMVVDFFAGSGTTGEAALRNGRNAILVDENPMAVEIMHRRFSNAQMGLGI